MRIDCQARKLILKQYYFMGKLWGKTYTLPGKQSNKLFYVFLYLQFKRPPLELDTLFNLQMRPQIWASGGTGRHVSLRS